VNSNATTGLFPVVVMALLAGLTFWLDRATQPQDDSRSGKHRHDPDFIVDNFRVRRFAADGGLQHTLLATKMLHYADDESTEVVAPRLTYHRTPLLNITANTAWLDKDGKHVRLNGDVRIVRDAIGGKPPTEIDTSVLHAVPDDEFAHTAAAVKITQGLTVLHGTGMESNNKTQISVLFGPTNGIIHNNQTNEARKQ
jgi:lipopolysaccharide export system protein LptC